MKKQRGDRSRADPAAPRLRADLRVPDAAAGRAVSRSRFSSGTYLQFPPPGFSLQMVRALLRRSAPGSMPPGAACRSARRPTVLALALGMPLAFGLARGRFRGRALIENGISAPIIVPHIVLSIAIYGLFAKLGLIGEWYGLAVAHTVLALPFVVHRAAGGPARLRPQPRAGRARPRRQPRSRRSRTVTLPILRAELYLGRRSSPSSPRSTSWWWRCSFPAPT